MSNLEEKIDTILKIVTNIANDQLEAKQELKSIKKRLDDLESTVLGMNLPESNPIRVRLAGQKG
jgi:septation ring formation regulator EzrA